jgi:PAS domain S-box-containing protein
MGGYLGVKNIQDGAMFTITLPDKSQISTLSNVALSNVEFSYNIEESTLQRISRLEKEVAKQAEVEKALGQWEDIFKQTYWGVSVHKGNSNNFEMINPAFKNMYGYTQEELNEMTIFNLCAPQSINTLQEKLKEALEKSFSSFEVIHRKKDGTKFPVNIDLTVIKDENGDILYHIVNVRDITEQKNAQKELLLLDTALNNTDEATYMTVNERIIQVNNGACNMLGYSREELTSMTLYDIDKDLLPGSLNELRKTLKDKKTNRFERKHYTKDWRILNVEITTTSFGYDDDTYSFSSVRDITEQKKAREELLLKEFALDTINEAVFLIDKDSMFHYVNEGACHTLGYTKEELLSMGAIDIDIELSTEFWNKHWESIKNNKSDIILRNHRRKNGMTFPVEVSANYFEYNGMGYNLAVVRDITERIRLEEQKDNERMRLFFERQIVGMAITSVKEGWVQTNDKLCEILKYSHEELSKINWVDITHPEDRARDLEQFNKIFSGEIDDYTLEKRAICKNNEIIYINLSVSCVRHEDGSVDYILALIEDITERKEMEQALKTSEQKFRTLIENATDNIVRYDKETRITYMNPQVEKALNISAESVIGKTPTQAETDGIFTELELELKKVIATGENTHIYITLPDFGNGEQYHNVQIVAERDIDDNIIGAIVFGRDVTELTNKTMELQKSLEFNEGVIAAIPDLLFEIAPDGTYIGVWAQNPEVLAAQKEILLGNDFKEVLPPDVVETAIQTFKEVDEKGSSLGNTYSLDLPYGKRWFELSAAKKKSSGNYIVLSRDITERKKQEELLRQKEEESRALLNNLPGYVYTLKLSPEKEMSFIYLSKGATEIYGLNQEDTLDDMVTTIHNSIHPDDLLDIEAKIIQSSQDLTPFFAIYRINHPKDGEKWLEARSIPEKMEDGTIIWHGIVLDVTKRKEIEKELADSYNFLHKLIDSIPDPIFVKDREHNWTMLNEAFCSLINQPRDVLIGKSDYDFFPKEEADIFWKKDELVFESGEVNINEEEFTDSNNTTHYIQTVKTMFVSSDEDEYLVGTIRDITERKKMEDAIRALNETLEQKVIERTKELSEKERELRTIAENIPDFIARYDKECTRVYVNKAVTDYFNVPKEELLGNSPYSKPLIGVPKEFQENILYVIQTGKTTDMEAYNELIGEKRWWNIIFTPEFDQQGAVEYVLTIAHDITSIKQAEREIKEREEKFSQLFMLSPVAVSLSSIERMMYLEINDGFLEYTKYTREEVIGKSSSELQVFADPNERDKFFHKVLEDGFVKGFEFQYKAKDGTTGYGLAYASVLYIQGEKCLLSHSYPINARKQLELVNMAINNTSEAIYISDKNLSILYVNEGACKMLGFTNKEFTSMKIYDIDAIFSKKEIEKARENILQSGESTLETKHKRKDGTIIDVTITGSSFVFNGENVELSVVKDITQLKKLQTEQKELTLKLEQKVQK